MSTDFVDTFERRPHCFVIKRLPLLATLFNPTIGSVIRFFLVPKIKDRFVADVAGKLKWTKIGVVDNAGGMQNKIKNVVVDEFAGNSRWIQIDIVNNAVGILNTLSLLVFNF